MLNRFILTVASVLMPEAAHRSWHFREMPFARACPPRSNTSFIGVIELKTPGPKEHGQA